MIFILKDLCMCGKFIDSLYWESMVIEVVIVELVRVVLEKGGLC